MFFRFSEDRLENDFKVIFYLPKAEENSPKSPKSGPKSSKKTVSKKQQIFKRFFHENSLQKGAQRPPKATPSGNQKTLGEILGYPLTIFFG